MVRKLSLCIKAYNVKQITLFARNNQALPSGGVPGSGSQGKDPLAPALPGNRNMYQHPAVSGYNTQDSRAQSMPVTVRLATNFALRSFLQKCISR